MRVLVVDPYYEAFLRRHYDQYPDLATAAYEAQWSALMARRFSTSDAYSHHLKKLGVEAHEVVPNCAPLQEAWLRENGARVSSRSAGRRREQDVLLAQVRQFEPDVVYVHNMKWMLVSTLRRLRRHTGLVAGQIASEAPGRLKLALFDVVLTSFPHYVERFRRAGARSELLPLAFDERVLRTLEHEGAPVATGGAVFVGALHRFLQHRSGNAAIAAAAEKLPIELWGYRVGGWGRESAVRNAYRGEAWGLDMYRVLRSARISINRHIGIAGEFANNLRLYESTGVGSMLLTDAKKNLADLFEPEREVATYRDPDELVEKIAYYLEHEDERAAIAAAGQQRTLRAHTYDVRMRQLLEILEREVGLKRTRSRRRPSRAVE